MSVTTVPLRPVGKGGLWLLWIGVAALLAIAAGVAWSQTRVNGFEVVKAGEGPSPTDEDIVLIKYTGRLSDGTVFDQQEQAPLPVAGSVPGFSKALKKMQRGGKYKIVIPPEEGYGEQAAGPIPPNSTLYFDVELLDFRNAAEVRAMMQQMQQMQGGPGGPPSDAPQP
ncbi:FKBP-type peptidyl-prolyl cis-trans isomerase [Sphingopyxis panaciterrulae]|uniref:Peptidyl-prolyl cis-trans isomerase n=1 Tax=Sphingopyxis panaciterrulae TaxID=462372 RepID=A0A7W9B553_9SPHN|nr:FKBP-type peptidyl-prolyl cis-trans isomerase [Sphingopyxis panaciterrulae]MBB5706436.1 FKBP-type peptidyl-prolyl cis-trans isomerase FkpA [Sphingopyxis panaciterrulae]